MKPLAITRRTALLSLGSITAAATLSSPIAAKAPRQKEFVAQLAALQARSGGRLGAYLLDTASGESLGLNADARFGMCSTFKLLLAAAVLREADAGRLSLDSLVPYSSADIVAFSPVTEANLAQAGMTVVALAEATQKTSDNTAANLLLRFFDGPAGFTRYLRALGDPVTRIDRLEPTMNLVRAGDERDTTTPRAMAHTAARILTTELLTPGSRARLIDWMIATETGKYRIRAGLPPDWRAGDKTGSAQVDGLPNRHNDVAFAWPPGRQPIVIATYLEASDYFDPMRAEDNAVLADVGRIAGEWLTRR
jgi:beta-lactamase class A